MANWPLRESGQNTCHRSASHGWMTTVIRNDYGKKKKQKKKRGSKSFAQVWTQKAEVRGWLESLNSRKEVRPKLWLKRCVAGMHGNTREPHVRASARYTFKDDITDRMTTKRHSLDWPDYPTRETDGRRK